MVQHAIVMATESVAGTDKSWWNGENLHYHSSRQTLQNMVKDGGTLWVFRSSRIPGQSSGTKYALRMCLKNCQAKDRPENWEGDLRFGVVGDPKKSRVYAPTNAKNLLMSLRFDPVKPIRSASLIGQSLQQPRRLNSDDVLLLEEHQKDIDRWSVFISYRRSDEGIAENISTALAKRDIGVYRDKEALKPGDQWWPNLLKAIYRSQFLLLLIGPDTHDSSIVKQEIQHALDNNREIIPILAGGDINKFPNVQDFHGLEYNEKQVANIADIIARKIS